MKKDAKIKITTNAELAKNASGLQSTTPRLKISSIMSTKTKMAKSPGGKSENSSEENTTTTGERSERPEEQEESEDTDNGEKTETLSEKIEPSTDLKRELTKDKSTTARELLIERPEEETGEKTQPLEVRNGRRPERPTDNSTTSPERLETEMERSTRLSFKHI